MHCKSRGLVASSTTEIPKPILPLTTLSRIGLCPHPELAWTSLECCNRQINQFVSQKHMNQSQPKNPLHGITLKSILEYLVAEYGWEQLGDRINIHCFNDEPSINSSLKFLRQTDWARAKVERLYLNSISYDQRKGKNRADANEIQSKTGSVWDRARKD